MKNISVGTEALDDPFVNQGTAFSQDARIKRKLRGLLPPRVTTLEHQAKRALERILQAEEPLQKYEILSLIRHRNATLFYYLLENNIEELMPIVYTPTVGKACQEFDRIYTEPEGLYVTIEDKGSVQEVINNWPHDDVDMIVVTDGERILGLGDLGAGGMGIPIGKLSLYTACAGLNPARSLPVLLDVGTNNQGLLHDPLYLGLQQLRVDGEEYYAFVREFIEAAKARWPHVIIQFEDFANRHAFALLDQWKDKTACFNDDIQGTAAVAVAGFYAAARVKGSSLSEEKFLFLGAGEAAGGIADLLVEAMMKEGLTQEQAVDRIFLFDSHGLVTKDREGLTPLKQKFAHEQEPQSTFLDAIGEVKPTAIVGCAAQAGSFNAYVLSAMARINERPIIFALSNPTSRSECTAREAYTYTEGKCLFASGSPFPQVEVNGKTFIPRQSNNSYVFPGIGLGLVVSSPRIVPQSVFLSAAEALSKIVSEDDLENGSLFPSLTKIREVSQSIAAAVAEQCFTAGVAGVPKPDDLSKAIQEAMYKPVYDRI
ncbi:oxaloacetate-decarboxylating malate dehydrogenase [Parasutterella excrementihominis]|uniref:Oxaloacetate-decarboxylating malate dehydrogenase n=1 Tax=Parasutterella excrementihominis TaxID=487175 RepID=A0A844LCZ5_9BURK|nr:NAD-dependent malic enzyme [Parasutterella excrementihominis]MTU42348.1 oxaloacetate-decarboxylating malate dehydrogenase [Parasutterella excrementihominis]